MEIALKIAVCAFVFSEILTSERMIFSFMRRLPEPFTCPYCIAGQLALWYYFFPYIWLEIIFKLSLPILIIHVFLIINERSQRDNKDSDANGQRKETDRGATVLDEPENEITQ